jgi:roadblock/LC7 domain-containing protein
MLKKQNYNFKNFKYVNSTGHQINVDAQCYHQLSQASWMPKAEWWARGMRYKLVYLGKGVTVIEQEQELGDDLHTQKRASIVGHQYTALDYLWDPRAEV